MKYQSRENFHSTISDIRRELLERSRTRSERNYEGDWVAYIDTAEKADRTVYSAGWQSNPREERKNKNIRIIRFGKNKESKAEKFTG